MSKLDEMALTFELVLISVVEALALIFLAQFSIPLLHNDHWLMYVPYILSGLSILLVFWAQATVHALSFVRWPLKMERTLLYFVVVLVQIFAYSNIDDMALWFKWWIIFSVVAYIFYFIDFRLIRKLKPSFSSPEQKRFIAEVEERHLFEMIYLVPFALAFNIIVWVITFLFPAFFYSTEYWYALPGALQLLISLFALYFCVRTFEKRAFLLPTLLSKDA